MIIYYTSEDKVKGKKNKLKKNRLKVGQKVKAKLGLAEDNVKNLVLYYGVGGKILERHLPEIYAWIGAHLSKTGPMGIIKHYGTEDNVFVEFVFDTELGPFEYGTYVSEKDLTVVKTKRKR
jgi:hypothetical protein